jgi:glycosyltransferase
VIENVIKAFEDKSVDAVYGDLLFVDANNLKTVNRRWIAGGYNKKSFYRGWMPPHPTFFVRREVYERFGQFNLNLKSSSDYELVLRFMLLHKIKVQYLPGVMIHMREGGYSNRSLYNRIAAHREDYLAWKLIGLAPKWYTVTMKPLRKIRQFATGDKSYTLNPFSFDPFLCHVWDGELSNSQTNLKTSGNSLNASSTES